MPRIIISYPNSNSFEGEIKIEKGLEKQVGATFAVIAHRLATCSIMDIENMKNISIPEPKIIIEVSGTKIDIKWNHLDNPQNQLRAIGEFMRVQLFRLWAVPEGKKIYLPDEPQFRA